MGATKIAAVIIALTSIQPSFALDDQLLGCWQLTESKSYFADGSVKSRKLTDCFSFIGATAVTMACGKPYKRNEMAYTIEEPGKIKYQFHSQAYQIDGDLQYQSRDYKPSADVSPDKAQTKHVVEWKRTTGADLNACLPAPMTFGKHDFYELFKVNDLIAITIEDGVASEIFNQFSREEFRNKVPEYAVKPADIKRIIIELNKIADEATKQVKPAIEKNRDKVEEIFFSPKNYQVDLDTNFAVDEYQQWARASFEEILLSRRLSSYLYLIQFLDPKKLEPFLNAPPQGNRVVSQLYGLGESFGSGRELMVTLASSKELLELMPDPKAIERGSKLALANAQTANTKYIGRITLDRSLYGATSQVMDLLRGETQTKEQREATRAAVARLAARVRLINPAVWDQEPDSRGLCSPMGLDTKSVVTSKGDWRKVRTSNDTPIDQGSWDHYRVFLRYAYGCDQARNATIARKVLEDIVSVKEPPLGQGKSCELAHWYRYGIGGPKSESKAISLENQFKAWANKMDNRTKACQPGQKIDPRDPWKDLY